MNVTETSVTDVLLLEPKVYTDARGFFLESYNKKTLNQIGIAAEFVQDNHSRSIRNVLRGLHYQIKNPQGKLVRVITGEVLDVAVDIRRGSKTFGKWAGIKLSAENKRMVWIPPGCAHGFLVLSDEAEVLYKTTEYWVPEHERCIIWNDPEIAIDWPLQGEPILSVKDRIGSSFRNAELYP